MKLTKFNVYLVIFMHIRSPDYRRVLALLKVLYPRRYLDVMYFRYMLRYGYKYLLQLHPPCPKYEDCIVRDKIEILGRHYRLICFLFWSFPLGLSFINCNFDVWHIVVWALLIIPVSYTYVQYVRWLYNNNVRIEQSKKEYNSKAALTITSGTLGAGKTALTLHDCSCLADINADALKLEYRQLQPFYHDVMVNGNALQVTDAINLRESYQCFFEPHYDRELCKWIYGYPCLVTSIPANINGVPTFKLKFTHLLQREKLAQYSVLFLDEGSEMAGNKLSLTKPLELEKLSKYPRQFGKWYIAITEQAHKNMYIGFKNSASEIRVIQGQKAILNSPLLNWLTEHKADKLRDTDNPTKLQVKAFQLVRRVRDAIGLRVIEYIYLTSVNNMFVEQGRNHKIVVPIRLRVKYDDRVFRTFYKAKSMPLDMHPWVRQYITEAEAIELYQSPLKDEIAMSKKERKEFEHFSQLEKELVNRGKELWKKR